MGALVKIGKFIKPYWKQVVLSIVMLAFVVAFDLLIPQLTRRAIDKGITVGDMKVVWISALLMLGASLLSAVFSIINSITSVRASHRFSADVREAVFNKIQSFSFGNLDHLTTGELIVNLTSDLDMVQLAFMMMMRMVTRAPLMMIGALILIFRSNVYLANRVLILMGIVVVVIVFAVPRMQKIFTLVQEKLDKLNTVMQENLAGVRVVKSFVRQDYEIERFGSVNQEYAVQNTKSARLMGLLFPLMFFILNLGIVLVIYLGGIQVINGDLSLGGVVAFINYLMMVMFPMLMLAMIIGMLASASASAKRILKVLDTEVEVTDKTDAKEMPKINGKVEFRNVSFAYRGSHGDPVLKNLNFSVEPGQTIAFLGTTGSGKTSLVNLIPRLYDVTEGQVLIDGIDVRDVTQKSLQSQIGVALQETILFSGTVAENIRYGKPTATDEEVRQAAVVAQADKFISKLDEGYDYQVGERGSNLSGGQKQRIAIARAVCMDPAILILDDSTSSVDVDTEARIQEEMATVLAGRTSFIIAQRISTVLTADQIIVLEDGQIRDIGVHKELMETCDVYRDIYDSQLGDGGVNND
ncbi:MAG: ABC transporter ATP-binding protein [Anaerolineaceae bacterium]|nr:ABC transporter ATP-binding protein [Anaerolineaceae bacterium]